MTDLDMTKLCAEAIGYTVSDGNYGPTALYCQKPEDGVPNVFFSPLTNDAQCMALVKKFRLNIGQLTNGIKVFTPDLRFDADSKDLNRAIVECVAKMRQHET